MVVVDIWFSRGFADSDYWLVVWYKSYMVSSLPVESGVLQMRSFHDVLTAIAIMHNSGVKLHQHAVLLSSVFQYQYESQQDLDGRYRKSFWEQRRTGPHDAILLLAATDLSCFEVMLHLVFEEFQLIETWLSV